MSWITLFANAENKDTDTKSQHATNKENDWDDLLHLQGTYKSIPQNRMATKEPVSKMNYGKPQAEHSSASSKNKMTRPNSVGEKSHLKKQSGKGLVYVSNLPPEITRDKIISLFSNKFRVTFCLKPWRKNENSNSACMVRFEDAATAQVAASEVNGTIIDGWRIKVDDRSYRLEENADGDANTAAASSTVQKFRRNSNSDVSVSSESSGSQKAQRNVNIDVEKLTSFAKNVKELWDKDAEINTEKAKPNVKRGSNSFNERAASKESDIYRDMPVLVIPSFCSNKDGPPSLICFPPTSRFVSVCVITPDSEKQQRHKNPENNGCKNRKALFTNTTTKSQFQKIGSQKLHHMIPFNDN